MAQTLKPRRYCGTTAPASLVRYLCRRSGSVRLSAGWQQAVRTHLDALRRFSLLLAAHSPAPFAPLEAWTFITLQTPQVNPRYSPRPCCSRSCTALAVTVSHMMTGIGAFGGGDAGPSMRLRSGIARLATCRRPRARFSQHLHTPSNPPKGLCRRSNDAFGPWVLVLSAAPPRPCGSPSRLTCSHQATGPGHGDVPPARRLFDRWME